MLMITVMAFATDYKGQLDYTVTTRTGDLTGPSNAQGVLKIEPYAGGKYTVTATGCDLSLIELGNWDEIICEGVEGTTDANGVTTINVAPYAFRGSDNAELKNAKLFVKFKGDKAYATFEGTYNPNFYANYKLKYTFGVDEGFDGGGSTGGGEDKPAAFEKVNFVGDGTNFNWSIPVNWDTQKIVMSIDPSTCTGNCEDIIGLGEVATAWNNTLHLYRKTDKTLQGYFQIPGGSNNNTNPFDETNPIKVEVSKAQGFVVNGVVKIPASQMSALFALSTVNMGTGEGANDKSRATYNYVKVVDKDWTEVPPVTVKDTKKFENVAYTTSMGGSGTATVTFTEMSDDTFPMTFVSDDLNVKAENLTKGTDEKGRTTYTGTAKRTDVDVTFTVKAVVYGETTAQKLYMTMDNGSSLVVTVGEDPDAPKVVATVPFTGVTLSASNGVTGTADVTFKEMSDNTVQMTFNGAGYGISATNLTKGTDTKGRTTYTGEAVNDAASTVTYTVNAVVYSEDATQKLYMTMVSVDGTTFTVGENPDAVTESSNKKYTSNLRILDGETTVVEEAEANVNIIKYSDESYKVTLKDVNILNKTQDLVFVGSAIVEEGPAEGAQPLTIMAKSDEATTTVFGEQVSGTFEITEVSADEIKMGFSMESQNFSYQGEFNYTEEEVEEPEVYTSNLHIYDAAAPETDLFQADQAKVEFLATATGGFKLTLKDVTLNEKTQDLVFTGTLPTPQPGGQEPLAEEGEGEVTPAEPAMVLNATADEATTRFFGVATYPTAVFNVSYDKNDNFMMTFTITAGAKNYGGEFNYVKKNPETPDVTVEVEKTFTDSFSLNNVSLGNAKVTIKEMSDKTINMVFTFGTNDFTSTDLVKGTDDKNRTTYTGTISIGGVECVVNGVVYTKDNAEKLYMTLVSTTSGTYVFGTEPTDTPEPPVVEEYPINFDKDANSTHSSRVLNSFSLQQTGKDKQTKSVKTSKAAYEDHTADEPFTVEAGSELTASFDYTGEWMHSFVYIDFDNDGQFSYKEGQWDQTGTDLVAFSFYSLDSNPKNDASGYNSVGDELTGDARNTYVAPSFKAPAKAGEYRIRFKFDWNCILPGGSSSILSDGGGVWDATLKVVEPVVDGISSINAEVANGEAQLFTIDGVKLNKLQKGLNIVRTADGKVKKVLVK